MCGRFALTLTPEQLAKHFGVKMLEAAKARYNIAPTQSVWAVRQLPGEAERRIDQLKWGLIPFWAKDPKIGARMFNARSETLSEKPSFREAYKMRRCLIPATGFFEWQKKGKDKNAYFFARKDAEPMAFAGLWESWVNAQGDAIESCTIITTEANELMTPYHHRMPVILDPASFSGWLDPTRQETAVLNALLVPYRSEDMTVQLVGDYVNKAGNDDPDVFKLT